ncbi:phosphoribosyltransferase domain-containing protein [Sulfuricurvum sp.]|uniref:phosphoribosyltransferase n=1 Tax=Sulfuricurvum sp. TaxID=2025608 RepID=UPI002E314FB8|nr:phosphoribosyltransferase domain-containing protein [Sulfuricurvum sp.]HEX5330678.1 phosphoribosyltransferase domain-containing protein [Sulfuricurvum sp.]
MITYNYEHFKNDLQPLSTQCEAFQPDTILGVARGGVTLAHALSMSLEVRNLQSIRVESYDGDSRRESVSVLGKCDLTQSKRVLVVDDIVDSGHTLAALMPILSSEYPNCDFKIATLFTKPTALLQPDFCLHEAHEWIEFFWERDFLKAGSL